MDWSSEGGRIVMQGGSVLDMDYQHTRPIYGDNKDRAVNQNSNTGCYNCKELYTKALMPHRDEGHVILCQI